ncbi:MAG: SpoVR family protein [Thermomicrobium sp.]|nr:SpoVR family protein [Thermomicrobium sp.]MDW8059455.1 SpoVR family protein [Thermomicrobium sp.]
MTLSDVRELERRIGRIWEIGERLGLRPLPVHFEIVPASVMYEIGAYGLPGRFSHWTHGKAYQVQKTLYDYGLSKIYELVINSDPCHAFLLETNTLLQNTLVAAHVMAHADFFANNAYFLRTRRDMVDIAALHAERIERYEFEHGKEEVERLLDAVLAIQEHVDPSVPEHPAGHSPQRATRQRTPYDDLWDLDGKARGPTENEPEPRRSSLTPTEPIRDLLWFIHEHSPVLEDWERDVVAIVRAEMLYFLPQIRTKVANEGWATLWHARIMHELDLAADEHVEFARLHAAVLQPAGRRLNPYALGYEILCDIERRYGTEHLFLVREVESDVSLVRNYLTEELVERLDLYLYERRGDELVVVDKDWESVRDRLASELGGNHIPVIVVEDGDYLGNRELYLRHVWDGRKLDLAWAEKTLEQIYRLWGRRVWLETRSDDGAAPLRLSYHPRERHRRHRSAGASPD